MGSGVLMGGWVGSGWVSCGSGWVCGMRLGCVFCCCFYFSVVVILVFCCVIFGVRWWDVGGALMVAGNWDGLWVVVGVVGFFILYFYILLVFLILF